MTRILIPVGVLCFVGETEFCNAHKLSPVLTRWQKSELPNECGIRTVASIGSPALQVVSASEECVGYAHSSNYISSFVLYVVCSYHAALPARSRS